MSVSLHLTNKTNNIIKGGIMESCVNGDVPYPTPNWWSSRSLKFEQDCGCNYTNNSTQQLNCMKSIDANVILKNTHEMYWPTVKTELFKDQPIFLYQNGDILDVPFIIGNNLKELDCPPIETYKELNNSLVNSIGYDNTMKAMLFIYLCCKKYYYIPILGI